MPEDKTVPQEKFDEIVQQRDKLKTDLREVKEKTSAFEEEIATLKQGVLSAEEKEMFIEWQEAKAKKEAGETITKAEMQRIREADTQKHQTELEQMKTDAESNRIRLDAEIDRLTVDSQIEMAVIGSGVERSDSKDVVAQVVQLIKPSVKREKTDDGYRVVCIDEDDNIRQTPDGILLVSDHVLDFLKDNPHFLPTTGNGPHLPGRLTGKVGSAIDYWERSPMDNMEEIYNK